MNDEKDNEQRKKSLKLGLWMLGCFADRPTNYGLFGDMEEMYQLLSEESRFRANLWLWSHLVKTVLSSLVDFLFWRIVMFNHYMKTAIRNIRKHKGYSLINIFGLAMGMACCILMFLWVQDELGYDRFHKKADALYRVTVENQQGDQISHVPFAPYPLGPVLKAEYPEIVNFTRYTGGYTGWNLHYGEKSFVDDRIAFADPSFFEMFTFPFISGDLRAALKERYSVVLTEQLAQKCFGDEDPMGKVMQMHTVDLKVTGIIRNIPKNSHMQFDYIVPIINQTEWREQDFESWQQGCPLYIELRKNGSGNEVGQKISGIIEKYHPKVNATVHLQPLKKIHLFSDFQRDGTNVGRGNIIYVAVFSLTALCILMIACINFMNLSTARSGTRAKEVGMRKVAGAKRGDIVKQFFGESLILSFIALFFAILLAYLLLPTFNSISGKQLTLNVSGNGQLLLGFIAITLFTGIISGSYPALFLSSFRTVNVLGGSLPRGTNSRALLRKILVVTQFSFTIILIIGTTVIYSQLDFMRNKPLGFDKDHIVSFPGYGRYWDNYESARNELLQNPSILNMTKAFPPSATGMGITDFYWEGKSPDEEIVLYPVSVGFDYVETFRMEIIEGRSFSRDFPTDRLNCIINETAARVMALQSPVGKRFSYTGNQGYIYGFDNQEGVIIGVVKDYHSGSLHNRIPPIVLKYSDRGFFVNVKINSSDVSETLRFLETKWKEFVPGRPFKYNFLDETIENYYQNEQKIATSFRYFTILAIFIASLGLFGLASYMAEQRTKEIGIRKVLGATVSGIVLLLSKEFTKWVMLANIFGWPIAYFAMKVWLQNFAYRIEVGWWIFILSGILALVIAMATVSYQAFRAAVANPVDSLRYE